MEITKNDLIQSILEQMKEIYPEIPEKRLNNLEKRLQNATTDELTRVVDAFSRFGAEAILSAM
jgi:hypothetical protein